MVSASRLRFPRKDLVPAQQFLRIRADFKEGIQDEAPRIISDEYKKVAFFSLPKSEFRPLKFAGDCSALFTRYAAAHYVDVSMFGADCIMLRSPNKAALTSIAEKIRMLFQKYAALDVPVATKACWVCPVEGVSVNDRIGFTAGGKTDARRAVLEKRGGEVLGQTVSEGSISRFVKLVSPLIKADFIRLFDLQVRCKIRVQFGLLKVVGVPTKATTAPERLNEMFEQKSDKLKPKLYTKLGDMRYYEALVEAAEDFNKKTGIKNLDGDPVKCLVYDSVIMYTTDGDEIALLRDGTENDRNGGPVNIHGYVEKSEPMVTSKAIACACSHRGCDFQFTFESDDTEDMTAMKLPILTQNLAVSGNPGNDNCPYTVTWPINKNLDAQISHVEIKTTRLYSLRDTSYQYSIVLTRRWNGPTTGLAVAMETRAELFYDEWDREVSTSWKDTKKTVDMKGMFSGTRLSTGAGAGADSYEEGFEMFMGAINDVQALIEQVGTIE